MSKTIGIIGCGWLGLPLAKSFISDGYEVYGTTTSSEKYINLEKNSIRPFIISLKEDTIEGDIKSFLLPLDILVINVPPKLRGPIKENYVKKMQLLHNAIKTAYLKKIVFVSSTSVYGEIDGIVTEETIPKPETASGIQMLASENIFAKDEELETIVIRFAGLIGPDRHPVTNLSKKKTISNGNYPVNLIHLDDCIRLIKTSIEEGWWQEIINGVFPYHPLKQEYYSSEALKKGLETPNYTTNSAQKGKKVTSIFLENVKIFDFKTTIVS